MEDAPPPIVIDTGSDTCKAGFAGDDEPRSYFPSVVSKEANIDSDQNISKVYVGDEALTSCNTISRPVRYRTITSWEDIEHLWRYCFETKLNVNPEEYPILLTEAPLTEKPNREMMIYTMFEEFNVPAFYVSVQGQLAMYAAGRATGISFDCGHDITHVVPVYEGYMLPHAVCSVDFGGSNMTNYLKSLLEKKGLDFKTEIVRDIKEKHCYLPLDYYEEIQKNKSSSAHIEYELPDGKVVEIDNGVLFNCPETLFHQLNYEQENFNDIYRLVYDSIQKCDLSIKHELYKNVVLSGGSTMFKGIAERMKRELQEFTPIEWFVNVVASPERRFLTWIGGSILASLTTFQTMWVSKDEYEECGPPIVHRKCF